MTACAVNPELLKRRNSIIVGLLFLLVCGYLFAQNNTFTAKYANEDIVPLSTARSHFTTFDHFQEYVRQSEPMRRPAGLGNAKGCAEFTRDNERLKALITSSPELLDVVEELREQDMVQAQARKGKKAYRRRRVLFVSTMHAYLTQMDRWFFHLYYDASRFADWETYFWGPGMPAYDDTLTLAQNLRKNFPRNPVFDVIFIMHSYLQSKSDEQATAEVTTGMNDFLGSPITAAIQHEMVIGDPITTLHGHMRVLFEAYVGHITGVGAKYMVHDPDTLVKLAPHAVPSYLLGSADDSLYKLVDCGTEDGRWKKKWDRSERTTAILLAGSLNRKYYPIRAELYDIRNSPLLTTPITVHKHPGYTELVYKDGLENECRVLNDKILPQYGDFMHAMRIAKICIVGGSKRNIGDTDVELHYAIRKNQEAMASGCLMVGDLPDNEDVAKHIAVKLRPDMTEKELTSVLNKALAEYDKGLYDDHIRRAYCAARRRYNYGEIIKQYLEPAFAEYDEVHGNNRLRRSN